MSDIAFLLIIFFAVAGKFTQSGEKDVVLPGADMGEENQPRDIEVVVTKDGTFFVNGARTEKEGLQDEIEVYLPQDTERAGRTVVIYADRDAQYATVATAIEAVNKADAYLELAVIKD